VRGNPIKEWIIFSIFWMILLIPVIKLTGGRKQPQSTTVQEQESTARTVQAATTIRYTGQPLFFRIFQGEKILCEIKDPPLRETWCKLPIQIEDDFAELYLQAQWPDGEEHVFEIELSVKNAEERKAHCWAQRELHEVVSFNW
jgi:hypothetical protein